MGVSLANGQSPALPLTRAELLAHCTHPDKEKTPEPLPTARGQSKRDLDTIRTGLAPGIAMKVAQACEQAQPCADKASLGLGFDLKPSSKANPCPICGRTKDGDCRTRDGLAICHRGSTHQPPEGLQAGDVVDGNDGQRWAFTGDTADGRAATFTIDKPRARASQQRRTAPQGVEIARLPEPSQQPPDHLPDGKEIRYSETQWVTVKRSAEGEKKHLPWHETADGRKINRSGSTPWPLWKEAEALAHGSGRWITEAEGEKCSQWLSAGGLVAVSQPGHDHKPVSIEARYRRLKEGGVLGVVYLADNDETGRKKGERCAAAAGAVGLAMLVIQAADVWPGLPEGGSIDDAPGTAAERVAALIAKVPEALKRTTQAKQKDHSVERSAAVAAGAKGIDAVLAAVGTGWRESTRTGLKTGDLSGLLKALDGRLGFDELAMGPAVDGVPLKDWEVSLLHAQLSEGGWKIGKDDAVAGLLLAARRHSFHPVRQYLKRVEADQSIEAFNLDDVAPRFFRAHSRLHQTMVRKWLIGAVARAMEPGCQMDYCLVLQSDTQGLGKSTSFRELASPEWFCSTFPDDEKDQTLNIHSSWIFELAELEAVTGSKAAGKLKNQITTAIDVFRAPYGQRPERHARSGVFCGTVNKQTFLKDDTGNRRFWVVPIEGTEKLDREGLAAARDGIWKAAVLAWRAGERPMLPIDLSEASEQQNEDHRETDSWLPLVAQYLDRCQQEEQVPVAVKNVLGFIGLSADRQSPRQARRAREAAESLGWRHRTRRRPDGTRATGLWPLSTETTQATTQATQATTQAKSSDAKGSAPLSIEATQKTPNLAKKGMEGQEEAAGEKKQGKREVFWVASIDRDQKPSDAKGSEEIPWVVASVDRAVPSVVSVVSSSPTIPGLELPSGPIGSGADVMTDGDDPAWSQRVA